VKNFVVEPDPVKRLHLINDSSLDLRYTAILSETPAEELAAPDSSRVEVISHNPNRIDFQAYTDKTSLLVFSENYYPPGWKIMVNNEKVSRVYEANHSLQAIALPAGQHSIVMEFAPASYFRNIRYAQASLGIIYLVIAICLILKYKPKILKRASQ
jgi:uncharacterized membrane protein YfhO